MLAIFATALGVSTPAPAQEAAYPAKEIFEAFRDGCGLIENQESTAARLGAAGWREVPPALQTGMLRDFFEFSSEAGQAASEAEGMEMSDLQAFEKVISSEKVYIILDEVRADGIRVSGCQLYDFGETRPISAEMGAQLLGRAADSNLKNPEIQRSEWQPGIMPEHDSFKIFFVPSGSQAAQIIRFTGLALMSDTVGAD